MAALDYLQRTLGVIACNAVKGDESADELFAMWQTASGIELCRKFMFPKPQFFEDNKDELRKLGLVDGAKDVFFYNRNIVMRNSSGIVEFMGPTRLWTLVLYEKCNVIVKATNYAVVRIADITRVASIDVRADKSCSVIKY